MNKRYIFDIETDGFLENCSVVHSLSILDVDTGVIHSFTDNLTGFRAVSPDVYGPVKTEVSWRPIAMGLNMLASDSTEEIIGHNIIKFDIPVLKKLYPLLNLSAKVTDTLIMARVIYPEIANADWAKWRKNREAMPVKFIGRHSLEAWGTRMGTLKGDYSTWMKSIDKDPWIEWNVPMQDYCDQDVTVNKALFDKLVGQNYNEKALDIEHRFADLMYRQEEYGFHFNEKKAEKLTGVLMQRRAELCELLNKAFPPWVQEEEFIPKRDNKTKGYKKGVPFIKKQTVQFSPSSRDMIADQLIKKYKWKPSAFTDTGKPKIDEEVLSELIYPEAELISEFFIVNKRLGQVAEGRQAWMKSTKNGKIHGSVNSTGAVTRRCTHSRPNVAQTPKVQSPYGAECRELFMAPKGYSLIGADASGLELRCLAHYMEPYDKGAYIKAVVEGHEDTQDDVHSLNSKALGFEPQKLYSINGKQRTGRDVAKTFIYAFLYGAGGYKIGTIVGVDDIDTEEVMATADGKVMRKISRELEYLKIKKTFRNGAIAIRGAELKAKFITQTPALRKLQTSVETALKARPIKAIDGGALTIRHKHAALNTLLQSAGSIAVKLASCILDDTLRDKGWVFGIDWAMCAHIHDEFQCIVRNGLEDDFKQVAEDSFRIAGEQLKFKCPLAGVAKQGANWKETH